MVINSANRQVTNYSLMYGFTLIEVLLVNGIGVLIMLAASFMVMSVQKTIIKRSEQLLVIQNINDALRYIKLDIQKAGFNESKSTALTLLGATSVINTTPTSIEYGYQQNGIFTLTHFKRDGTQLDICTNNSEQLQHSNSCSSRYFSLMDDKQVKVDRFQVEQKKIDGNAKASLITIVLSASLLDGRYPQTVKLNVTQRNL